MQKLDVKLLNDVNLSKLLNFNVCTMGLGWFGGTICRLNQTDVSFTWNLTRHLTHALQVENWDCIGIAHGYVWLNVHTV